MAFMWWTKLCIILHTSASFVLSGQGIYVSRLHGNDRKICGKLYSPCRTISYGIRQVSTGSYIYLDGSATSKNPYTCEALGTGHPGIYLTKSISFVSIRSRAYISCLHGNQWFANGTNFKDGVRISFSGLTFLNTSLRLFDTFMVVNDTVFAGTKLVSLYIEVLNLPRFDLSLRNVVFQQNAACIAIIPSKGSEIFVNITNTLFYQNGNFSLDTPSILWLNCTENFINFQLRNCSFKKNAFKRLGMIVVFNQLGTTNFLLNQFRLEENGPANPSIEKFDSLFRLRSARILLRLECGFVYKTSPTFLTVWGYSAQIKISNIQVDGFYTGTPGGGVVTLFQYDSCYLSLKDSSFRNGNNNGTGAGVVSITAPYSVLTIQNSTIQNITNLGGSTVKVFSLRHAYLQSSNHSKIFFVHLRITNSSFSHTKGGNAVQVIAETLLATVNDSLFLRNTATTICGVALCIITSDSTTINLHNVYFLENSAEDRNFTKNSGSSIIAFDLSKSTLNFVNLDTCIFRENIANFGTVYMDGRVALTCKHSIFDSNSFLPSLSLHYPIILLYVNSSTIFFKNTTFVDNLCTALMVHFSGNSNLSINDSAFVRNKDIESAAGALGIRHLPNQINQIFKAFITRVLFQENIAASGSVLSVASGDVLLANCTFLNNFARFQGGQIVSDAHGSVHLAVFNSVFKQTIQKIVIDNTKEFMVTSFLRLYNHVTVKIYNTTFNWDTIKSYEPLFLVSKAHSILFNNASMSTCPVGHAIEKVNYEYLASNYGYDISLTLSCKACDYDFYSLQRGTARGLNVDDRFECIPCPRGADCVSAIRSKSNFWGYQTSSNPPKLAFTFCPFGYCKPPPANSSKYNDCQGKRTGVMCGMCSQGYTEALWSTYCTPVKDCNDYWFWVLFLALVFSMAILLVFKPPFITYSLKQIFWFKRFAGSRTANIQAYHHIIRSLSVDEETGQENIPLPSTEELKQDKRQFSRFVEIIFYFYQIAQLLLSSSSLKGYFDTQFLTPVLGFFNFQPSFKKQGFLCPFPGLTPETKLVFKIAPVFGTLVAIFLIYALHFSISRMRRAVRPAISPYLQASIKAIFLSYVTLATVSISLIRCVFVVGETRWFYNGNIRCYQWWQYASFTFNAIFVIPFIFVLAWISFKLHQDKITVRQFLLAIVCPLPFLLLWLFRFVCRSAVVNVEENQYLKALKEMLLAPYRQPKGASKRGALYWQSVLIARRFILVLIFCVVTEPSIRLFCMTLACVFVFGCHLKVNPFQNSLANNLESLSLLFLVILGLVNLFKSVFVGSEQNIKGSLVTVSKVFQWLEIVMLGLFPAIILLLVCFAIISFFVRVLFTCFRSTFKCLFRPCAQRWLSCDSTRLLDAWDNIDGEYQDEELN